MKKTRTVGWGLVVATAVAVALAVAPGALAASGAARAAGSCDPSAQVALNVAKAAAVKVGSGASATTLGPAKAKALLDTLSGPAPCAAPGTATVTTKLAEVERVAAAGNLSKAKTLLRAVIASIVARRTTAVVRTAAVHHATAAHATTTRAGARARHAAGGCSVDRAPKVDTRKADRVGDLLKASETAQKIKDSDAAAAAYADAQQAYGDWAGKAMGDNGAATTVGDYVTIARGAQTLGVESTSQTALQKAAAAAAADVKKAAAFSRCTAKKSDVDCLVQAIAVAQSLGADIGDAAALVDAASKAVGDRLQHKPVDGCDEWSFQMKLTTTLQDGSTWGISWGLGRLRVGADSAVDGSHAAGYGSGWPGIIGDNSGRCIETGPNGRIDHGPALIKGGAFHYSIGGKQTAAGFALEVASKDADVTVTAPSHPACKFLGTLARTLLDSLVKGPLPLEIPVPKGQDTVNHSEHAPGYTFTITLQRVTS